MSVATKIQLRKLYPLVFISFLFAACGIFKHGQKSTTITYNELKIDVVIKTAKSFYNTPYRLGGTDKNGIDCSALVKISFENVKILLPRKSIEQSQIGKEVDIRKVAKGDLVFFRFDKNSKHEIDHVGIVSDIFNLDAIKFIHASTKRGVIEDDLSKPYNKKAFVKFMRVIN